MEMNNKPLSLLTIKGGSSSIKFALYPTGETLERRFYGKVPPRAELTIEGATA